ncbi:uncharacterized protein [Argopecten irradians]|uniref:uncharacterized protein isoform X1 n=1 Tax=Argopecten irradians TaxID=31199 RepID=UPI003711432C
MPLVAESADLKREVPGCLSDVIVGSASCVGLHGITEAAMALSPQLTDTAVTYQDAWCPSLKETTKCITIQTFGCSQNIHQGVADMTSGLMTTACQQTQVVSESENILESALLRCSMPLIVHIGLTTDSEHLPSLISTIVEGACSRLSHLMNCVDHYMPTSVNLLDKFVNNIVDMRNVKANLQAFSDGYCTSTAQAGVQTIVQCMMNLNNSEAVMNQCMTADINATFASMDNITALLALSENDIRTTYCSPLKTFVGCLFDTVETHCNDSIVSTMIGTSRDMLLAVLRTDCGGIRQDPNIVGDNAASGQCVQTVLFLLLSLLCFLFKY